MSSLRRRSLAGVVVAVSLWLAGCGGGAGIGERCDSVSDCAGDLQCLDHVCVPRCIRHTDCGDGHFCAASGICELSVKRDGEACTAEVECAPGQSCQLDEKDLDGDGFLTSACRPENTGGVLGDGCEDDADCRTGTCVIGRCVDVCRDEGEDDLDCPEDHHCTTIPRELPDGPAVAAFYGCLPARDNIAYEVPIRGEYARFFLPVPGTARSVAMIATIDDPTQLVGAARIESPTGELLYTLPFSREEYFDNPLRHTPTAGVSTLLIPQSPDEQLLPGAYVVEIGSYIDIHTPGTEQPKVQIVYKLGDAVHLDLHFHFLDLADHPCASRMDGVADATTAQGSLQFQNVYLRELNLIFAKAGIVFDREQADYVDLPDRPDLDGLDQSRLGQLLSLSTQKGGIDVYFVRSISPAGLQALAGGPPVPPATPGTHASGVAIAADTLCYASWETLARITAHEIARALGLSRSIEPDRYVDPISDSGFDMSNLMHFSEQGGSELSPGQSEILRLSPALR
jgi:hypothetical protein